MRIIIRMMMMLMMIMRMMMKIYDDNRMKSLMMLVKKSIVQTLGFLGFYSVIIINYDEYAIGVTVLGTEMNNGLMMSRSSRSFSR